MRRYPPFLPRLAGALLVVGLAVALGGCFPRQAGPRLAHFATTAPAAGDPLPAVTVRSLDGAPVELRHGVAELARGPQGPRPVVLRVGSRSCPVYRYRRFSMADLQSRFGDRVGFAVLYTREAHPVAAPSPYGDDRDGDGEADTVWDPWINRLAGVRVADHAGGEDRLAEAAQSRRTLEPEVVMWVDEAGDAAWRGLGAAPAPAFLLDPEGRVVLAQVWTDPEELAVALEGLLRP